MSYGVIFALLSSSTKASPNRTARSVREKSSSEPERIIFRDAIQAIIKYMHGIIHRTSLTKDMTVTRLKQVATNAMGMIASRDTGLCPLLSAETALAGR